MNRFIQIMNISETWKQLGQVLRKRSCHLQAVLLIVSLALLVSAYAHEIQQTRSAENGMPVHFTYVDPRAREVSLVGAFSRWSPQPMTRAGNMWKLTVSLPPGRYQYAFLVDGRHWRPDPGAMLFEDNGFGSKNSVLIVE